MKRRMGSRKRRSGLRRDFTVEGLEARRMLVGDAFVVGDSDHDGAFGTGDLVEVFQEGKFETGEEASFDQGDWNGDGFFDTSDLVYAFQNGGYNQPQPLAADDGTAVGEDTERDGDPNGNDADEPVDNGTGDPVDETPDDGGAPTDNGDHDKDHPWGHHFDRGERPDPKEMAGRFLEQMIGKLKEGIESGDLPGEMTQEQAEAIVEKLSEAQESGDFSGMRELVREWMTERKNEREEEHAEKMKEHAEKMAERFSGMLDGIRERIADGHLPNGMDPDEAQAFLDGIQAKLNEGELREAMNLLKELRGPWHRERPDNGENPDPDGNENPDNGEEPDHGRHDRPDRGEIHARMIGVAIDKMQEALDGGKLPAEAQAILDAARGALDEGDTKAAAKHLGELRHLGRDHGRDDKDDGNPDEGNPDNGDPNEGDPNEGDPNEGDPDNGEQHDHGRHDRPDPREMHARMLGAAIDKMQDALDSGKLPDEAQAILDAARGALDEGDTKAAAKHLGELRHLGRDHGHHDKDDDGNPDEGNPDEGDPTDGDPNEGPTDGPTDGDPNEGDDKPDDGRWHPEPRGRWSLEDVKAAFDRFRGR